MALVIINYYAYVMNYNHHSITRKGVSSMEEAKKMEIQKQKSEQKSQEQNLEKELDIDMKVLYEKVNNTSCTLSGH